MKFVTVMRHCTCTCCSRGETNTPIW